MNKKNFNFLFYLAACFSLFAGPVLANSLVADKVEPLVPITGAQKKDKKPLRVWASLCPHVSVIRAIGGDLVDVAALVPQSSDPHNFEMPPSQIEQLSKADVWFGGGEGFERQASSAISARVLFCDLNEGKPHGLLDPDSLKKQAEQVTATLKKLDSQNASYFERNLAEFLERIDLTDRKVKEILGQANAKTLLVMHPAFSAFCDYYGIEQVNVSTCDQSVAVRHIEHVEKRVQALKLKTLYVQPQQQSAAATAAAKKLQLQTKELDPYEEDVLNNFIKIARAASL